jgi:hypothetical protein
MKLSVPIPEKMQHLEIDPRGFPIPFIVLIDAEGTPHFKINDEAVVHHCLNEKVCHICGKKLNKEFWFIGGQISAFHPQGAFNDGAVHKECGLFALQVCPYMAYSQYKAFKTEDQVQKAGEKIVGRPEIKALYNPTQMNDRLSFFVLVKAKGYKINKTAIPGIHTVNPFRPYEQVEYWLDGRRIHKGEAKKILLDKGEKSYLT